MVGASEKEEKPSPPDLPALSKDELWAQEATRPMLRGAVLKVSYLMEPDMETERFKVLVQYLADQQYTAGELAYAADELPRDQQLDQKIRYGGRLTPADFERKVKEARLTKERLDKRMSEATKDRVLELEPALGPEHLRRQPGGESQDPYWIIKSEPLEEIFGVTRQRRTRQEDGDSFTYYYNRP